MSETVEQEAAPARPAPPVAREPGLAVSPWLAVLPYLAHIAGSIALAGLLFGLGEDPDDGQEFFTPLYALVILGSYVILAVATVVVARRTGQPLRALGLVRAPLWRSVGWVALIFVLSIGAALILEPIFHGAESQEGFKPDAFPGGTSAGLGLGLTILAICVLGPAAEELYFRGLVYGALRRYGPPIAIGSSALLFAAVHYTPRAIPVLFVLGAGLAFLYERTGSLWPPIVFHALNNSLAMIGSLAGEG